MAMNGIPCRIPQDTQAKQDEEKYEQYFSRSGNIASVIAEAKSGSNILTSDCLDDLMSLHWMVENLTVSIEKEDYQLRDLCVYSGYSSHPCYMSNVLGAWSYKPGQLHGDSDVLDTLNGAYSHAELEDYLGSISTESSTDLNVTSAKAVKLTYFLRSDVEVIDGSYVSEKNEAWEFEFLDLVHNKFKSSNIKLFPQATRSWSDEFGEAIRGDIVLVNIAFLIMIMYMSVNLGVVPCNPKNCPALDTRMLLALASVGAIGLSIVASYALCSAMGFKYTPVHGVLPFVILGLGVDDSFVIMNAMDQTPRSMPLPDRMAKALSHAATSITVTSLTDFVAFSISVSSSLPALSSFCMFAAVAILLLFLLQITFFASAVVLDERRQASRSTDCCPSSCCKSCCLKCCPRTDEELQGHTADGAERPSVVSSFMTDKFCPLILKPTNRGIIVAFFLTLLAVCAWGSSELSVESSTRSFIPDGSYLLKTLEKNDKYFGEQGENMWIVTGDEDYYSLMTAGSLSDLKDDVDSIPKYLQDPYDTDTYDSWYAHPHTRLLACLPALFLHSFQFVRHAMAMTLALFCLVPCVCGGAVCGAWAVGGMAWVGHRYGSFVSYCNTYGLDCSSTESLFYGNLKTFLDSSWGAYYNSSIIWNGNSDIEATRIRTQFNSMSKYTGGRLQDNAEKVVDAMEAVRDYSWSTGSSTYPFTYEFLTWETYKLIRQELILNVTLCLLAVLIITTLLIGHPGCSGLVFLCVCMTVVDILGCM